MNCDDRLLTMLAVLLLCIAVIGPLNPLRRLSRRDPDGRVPLPGATTPGLDKGGRNETTRILTRPPPPAPMRPITEGYQPGSGLHDPPQSSADLTPSVQPPPPRGGSGVMRAARNCPHCGGRI